MMLNKRHKSDEPKYKLIYFPKNVKYVKNYNFQKENKKCRVNEFY